MGVPNLYRFIKERYPLCCNNLTDLYQNNVDNLYLDATTIFYQIYGLEYNIPNAMTMEQVYESVFNYIDYIARTVCPRRVLYIAFDGPAPAAKLYQQRGRRSYIEPLQEYSSRLQELKGPLSRNDFNPGTVFTVSIAPFLVAAFTKKKATDPFYAGLNVIISGSDSPGEAEHKILDSIRFDRIFDLKNKEATNNASHYTPTCAIYSPDSDLIILSLISQIPNIVLVFEEKPLIFSDEVPNFDKISREPWGVPFEIISASILRDYFTAEFSGIFKNFEFNIDRFLDDFCLILSLCGNDFLPKAPSLIISQNIISEFLTLYKAIVPLIGWITDNSNLENPINFDILSKFFVVFSKFEFDWFKSTLGSGHYEDDHDPLEDEIMDVSIKARAQSEYSESVTQLENIIKDLSIEDKNDILSKYVIPDPAFLRAEKSKYYLKRLRLPAPQDAVGDDLVKINTVMQDYIDTVVFNFLYYTRVGVPDWDFLYPHTYAPCLSDFMSFKINSKRFKVNEQGVPMRNFETIFSTSTFNNVRIEHLQFEEIPEGLEYFKTDNRFSEVFCPVHYRNDLKAFRTFDGSPHHSYVGEFKLPKKSAVRELLNLAVHNPVSDLLSSRGKSYQIMSSTHPHLIAEFNPQFWKLFVDDDLEIETINIEAVYSHYQAICQQFMPIFSECQLSTSIVTGPTLYKSDKAVSYTSEHDHPFKIKNNLELFFCSDPRSLRRQGPNPFLSSPISGHLSISTSIPFKFKNLSVQGSKKRRYTSLCFDLSKEASPTPLPIGSIISASWPYSLPFKIAKVVKDGKFTHENNEATIDHKKVAEVYETEFGLRIDASLIYICDPITSFAPLKTLDDICYTPFTGSFPTLSTIGSSIYIENLGFAFPAIFCTELKIDFEQCTPPVHTPHALGNILYESLPDLVQLGRARSNSTFVTDKNSFIHAALKQHAISPIDLHTLSASQVISHLPAEKIGLLTISHEFKAERGIPFRTATKLLKVSPVALEAILTRFKVKVGKETIVVGFDAMRRSSKTYSPKWITIIGDIRDKNGNPSVRNAIITEEGFKKLKAFVNAERNFVTALGNAPSVFKISAGSIFGGAKENLINDFGPFEELRNGDDTKTGYSRYEDMVRRNLYAIQLLMLSKYGMAAPKVPLNGPDDAPGTIFNFSLNCNDLKISPDTKFNEKVKFGVDFEVMNADIHPVLSSGYELKINSIVQPLGINKFKQNLVPPGNCYGVIVAILPCNKYLVAWNYSDFGFKRYGNFSDYANMSIVCKSQLSRIGSTRFIK